MNNRKIIGWMAIGLFAAGCAPAIETRTYSVHVTNRMADPVTVFMTKDGPPEFENGWMSPEEIAAGKVSETASVDSGIVIGPKEERGATNVKGKFQRDTRAVLRVYHLTGAIEDFAAVSHGSDRRIDVPLQPGENTFEVTGDKTAFRVDPVAPPLATPAAPH